MKLKQLAFIDFGIFVLAVILVCQLTSLPKTVFAQDKETLNIMERLERLAQEIGSYQADVKTVTTINGKTSISKGKMKFMWPNLRWQENRRSTKRGERLNLFVSNGKVHWSYSPKRKFAFKEDLKSLDEDAREKGWASSGYLEEGSMQYVGKEKLENVVVFVFEGKQNMLRVPRNSKQPGKTRGYFGAQDGILRKFVEYDHQRTGNHFPDYF